MVLRKKKSIYKNPVLLSVSLVFSNFYVTVFMHFRTLLCEHKTQYILYLQTNILSCQERQEHTFLSPHMAVKVAMYW